MVSGWLSQLGSTVPCGEHASRAGGLISVCKIPDEISKQIQRLAPVSGSLLWSLNTNCFVQKSFGNAAPLLARTSKVWSPFRSTPLCMGKSQRVRPKVTNYKGLLRLLPLFIISLFIILTISWQGKRTHVWVLAFAHKRNVLWVSEYRFVLTFPSEISTLLGQPVISYLPSKTHPSIVIVVVDHSKQWSWVKLGFLRFLTSEDVLCFTGRFLGWRSGRELCVHWQWKADLATLSWWRTASRLFAEASPWQKEDKLHLIYTYPLITEILVQGAVRSFKSFFFLVSSFHVVPKKVASIGFRFIYGQKNIKFNRELPRKVHNCLSVVSWVYWRHLTQLWHDLAFLLSMWMAASTNNPAISPSLTVNALGCTVKDLISVSRVRGKALERINIIKEKNVVSERFCINSYTMHQCCMFFKRE